MKLPRLPTGWSRAGQTRSRLAALCLVAAVPITLMAATVVMQDYYSVNKGSEERAAVIEGQVLAELRGEIAATVSQAMVAALNHHGASTCDGVPAAVPLLLVFDADGSERCTVRRPPRAMPGQPSWFDRARQGAPFSLGLLGADGPLVVAASNGTGAVMAKVLTPFPLGAALADIASNHAAAWLLDDQRRIASAVGDLPTALPTVPVMAALLGPQPAVVRGLSAAGQRYAYATSNMAGGWKLVVAVSAETEHQKALRVLAVRTSELGALLLAGLAAMLFGADLAFGAPLRRLSESVRHWRAGEVFAPGDMRGAPDEVQQLAKSFAAATGVLRQKEAELLQAQEQQTLLVLEVHHRVKNNLQIIASLLNLQASRIRLPEARAEFQAARDRVRALATLHRHLYADGELHMINMRSFLTELCGQLFQAIGEVEGDRISLLIEAPELRLSSDEAVPMALIVTEIVTNSVKYAFPGNRSGTIHVSLTESGTALDLEISDDGVGIEARGADEAQRDGIGLRLIRGFSRQLGATLAIEHGHGTRYVIRLPMRPAQRSARQSSLDAAGLAGESAPS